MTKDRQGSELRSLTSSSCGRRREARRFSRPAIGLYCTRRGSRPAKARRRGRRRGGERAALILSRSLSLPAPLSPGSCVGAVRPESARSVGDAPRAPSGTPQGGSAPAAPAARDQAAASAPRSPQPRPRTRSRRVSAASGGAPWQGQSSKNERSRQRECCCAAASAKPRGAAATKQAHLQRSLILLR